MSRANMKSIDVAEALDVTPGLISQYLGGQTKIPLRRIVRLASIFGSTTTELVGPGSAYPGDLVTDEEELKLLDSFRRLDPQERAFVLRSIHNAAASVIKTIREASENIS